MGSETVLTPEATEQTTPDLDRIMTDGRTAFASDVEPDTGTDLQGPASDADILVGGPGADIQPPTANTPAPGAGEPPPPSRR
jgi:hypothetical protein